jgi:alpha-galactosidase
MTLWCLLASPLLLGNDLTKMDPFTLSLLENDEVLAVDQDELGKQADQISATGDEVTAVRTGRNSGSRKIVPLQVWARPLADGSQAVGLLNFGTNTTPVTVKFSDLNLTGEHAVRDLWRQKELGKFKDEFTLPVAAHGAEMVKIAP